MKWYPIGTASHTRLLGYDKEKKWLYFMHWGQMTILPKNGWVAEGAEKSDFSPTLWAFLPELPFNQALDTDTKKNGKLRLLKELQ